MLTFGELISELKNQVLKHEFAIMPNLGECKLINITPIESSINLLFNIHHEFA